MRLTDLKIGSKARIMGLARGDKHYRHRLIAMGLIPGTEFVVSRIAPLGDPIEIKIRDFALSLRKGEANILQLQEVLA
jgi:ferrous iron transport protein A